MYVDNPDIGAGFYILSCANADLGVPTRNERVVSFIPLKLIDKISLVTSSLDNDSGTDDDTGSDDENNILYVDTHEDTLIFKNNLDVDTYEDIIIINNVIASTDEDAIVIEKLI